jgi:hypothetical protein
MGLVEMNVRMRLVFVIFDTPCTHMPARLRPAARIHLSRFGDISFFAVRKAHRTACAPLSFPVARVGHVVPQVRATCSGLVVPAVRPRARTPPSNVIRLAPAHAVLRPPIRRVRRTARISGARRARAALGRPAPATRAGAVRVRRRIAALGVARRPGVRICVPAALAPLPASTSASARNSARAPAPAATVAPNMAAGVTVSVRVLVPRSRARARARRGPAARTRAGLVDFVKHVARAAVPRVFVVLVLVAVSSSRGALGARGPHDR